MNKQFTGGSSVEGIELMYLSVAGVLLRLATEGGPKGPADGEGLIVVDERVDDVFVAVALDNLLCMILSFKGQLDNDSWLVLLAEGMNLFRVFARVWSTRD